MIHLKKFSLLIAVIVALLSISPACAQNKVIPIDSPGIKQLISDTECPLLLVATAAWCKPCREELPYLNRIYEKYKEKGLKLVAVSVDMASQDMQRLVDKLDIKFPVYWAGEKMAFEYSIFGVPTILVVKNGQISERIIGKRSEKFLEEKVSELILSCSP
jgi:thiol-disulfide isomerase/thioredoxin